MYIASILLLLTQPIQNFPQPGHPAEDMIRHYLSNQSFPLQNSRNTIALVNAHLVGDVVPKWSVQIFNGGPMRELVKLHTRFDHVIVFLQELAQLNKTVKEFLDQPAVWFSEMQFHFFVISCWRVAPKALKRQAARLWNQHRLVNYRMAIWEESLKRMRVFWYSPGQDRLFLSATFSSQMDTLRNLAGTNLTVSVITLGPNEAIYENDVCTQGRLCRILNGFLGYIKADGALMVPEYNISMMFRVSKKLVMEGKVDISFGSHWLREDHLMFSTFSSEQAAVVAMVPRAKLRPMLLNVVYIYDLYVWFLMVVLHVFFRLFLNYSTLFLGGSLKILLLSSYIFSIYSQSTFQGAVITALTSPKYEREIDSVDDLLKRGLTIYGEDDWAFLISSKLKLTHMSYLDQSIELRDAKAQQAYLLTDYWAKEFVLMQAPDGLFYANYYHIVSEPIGMGRITFYIRRNSPYREAFNNFLYLINDYGLNLPFGVRDFRFVAEKTVTRLSLKHFHGAFVPLFCGLAIATLAFSVELFWMKPTF